MIVVAEIDALHRGADPGLPILVGREVIEVTGVMAFGILEPVFLVVGIEVPL